MGSWEAHTTPIHFILHVNDEFVWTSSMREIAVWKVNGMEIFCCKKLELERDCNYMYYSSSDNLIWTSVGDNILIWDPVVCFFVSFFFLLLFILFMNSLFRNINHYKKLLVLAKAMSCLVLLKIQLIMYFIQLLVVEM